MLLANNIDVCQNPANRTYYFLYRRRYAMMISDEFSVRTLGLSNAEGVISAGMIHRNEAEYRATMIYERHDVFSIIGGGDAR